MASMLSAATSAPAAQKNSVAPFVGLKSTSSLPISRKPSVDLASKIPKGGSSVKCCIQVWPPEGKKKFETLSYLPTLSNDELIKEVEYLIRKGWVPCIEFSKEGFVYRENHSSPGYYDGRYWTMWKLPMFGCTDAVQVVKEVEECKKAYPDYFNRIIGFDNKRQVQCVSFISYKPPSFEG